MDSKKGMGLSTYSIKEKDRLIEYVKNQEIQHHKNSFKEAYMKIIK
jgi:hypothetical protein